MKVNYYQDTDTLYIELQGELAVETRDFDEDTLVDLDAAGKLVAITIENASQRADVRRLTLRGINETVGELVTDYKRAAENAKLSLSENERKWLEQYRKAIDASHPGKVVRVALFGSKVRGDAHKYSDVDVLVIVNDDSVELKMSLQKIGCKLASNSLVLPGIVVYPEEKWDELKRSGSVFHESVEREAVAVP